MFIRIVKVPSTSGNVNEYVRVVEAYRDNGKVKQRVIADLGRKDLLTLLLPKLERALLGAPMPTGEDPDAIAVIDSSTWGPVLAVRTLFDRLGLWRILDELLPRSKKGPPFADRVFVLLANRLIRPTSEHGLARWLETDFVCDRQGRRFVPHWHQHGRVRVHHRQLGAWYRTLDVLIPGQGGGEVVSLYHRLRDLYSLRPRAGAVRHHEHVLRRGGARGFRQARLQPRRQVAERAGRRWHGDGGGLADRASMCGKGTASIRQRCR